MLFISKIYDLYFCQSEVSNKNQVCSDNITEKERNKRIKILLAQEKHRQKPNVKYCNKMILTGIRRIQIKCIGIKETMGIKCIGIKRSMGIKCIGIKGTIGISMFLTLSFKKHQQ